MAVVTNPLIGRASGSMGGATFSTWKGKNVLKDKATSVANPNTDAQQAQRSAFTQMVRAFRGMPSVIKAGFKKLAVGMSEFNAFARAILDIAFDVSVPPTATIVPANILISKGTITSSALTTAVADRSLNNVTVTFPTTASQPGQSVSDIALVAAYNETLSLWIGAVTGSLRSGGTATITLPAEWLTGNDVTIYLGFYNTLSAESSDSVNTSNTIVA